VGQSRSGLPDGIAAVDLAVMRRVEHGDSRLLDLVMPRLSRLADHGVLWTGLAFALWATGDRWARRAAWRGIGSLLAASAIANIAGKGMTARGRPEIRVPPARRLPRTPQTMSFPSGHAASAAAFATGVALEKPGLAAPADPGRRPQAAAPGPAASEGENLALVVNMSAGTASSRLAGPSGWRAATAASARHAPSRWRQACRCW
jgi:membrane-associated phospholipid phosphatase